MQDARVKEYARLITALNQTGILTVLPRSERPGVIGIDGEEYPIPTQEQLQKIFTRHKGLVARKRRQGFTRLQLTPIAMPLSELVDKVEGAVRKHAAAGAIIRTKRDPGDADMPARVNAGKPPWIWDPVRQAMDTAGLVYFPQTYSECDHGGSSKEEVMRETRFCAVPGWSVGLIEPIPVMPQQGQGEIKGGRSQLEAFSTPRDYLQTLSTSACEGETGWTLEDFLTHFLTQLDTTDQISHDRSDGNALWLLGTFMPNPGQRGKTNLVAVGYWDRGRIYLSVHRSGNRFKMLAARSMVRLGT